MLQRIQTIYLLLVAILMSTAACYAPLIEFEVAGISVQLNGLDGFNSKQHEGNILLQTWGIFSIGILSALLAFVNILGYKNRKKQMILCKVNVFLIILFYITIGAYVYTGQPKLGLVYESIEFGIILPVVALVFNILALMKIKADEKLIRSTERIR